MEGAVISFAYGFICIHILTTELQFSYFIQVLQLVHHFCQSAKKALPNSVRGLHLDLYLPILKLKSIPTRIALVSTTNLKCWHYHLPAPPPATLCLHKLISSYSLTPKASWLCLCTGQLKGGPVYVKFVLINSMIFQSHLHPVQMPGRTVIQHLKNVDLYPHS